MTNAWGSELVDAPDTNWDQVIYAPAAPTYSEPYYGDQNMTPAYQDVGAADPMYASAQELSYQEPYYGNQNMTPRYPPEVYAPSPQPDFYAPTETPDFSYQAPTLGGGFDWAPVPDGNDLALADGLQGYLSGEQVAPEWYAAHPNVPLDGTFYPPSSLDSWESPYNFTEDERFSSVSGDDIGWNGVNERGRRARFDDQGLNLSIPSQSALESRIRPDMPAWMQTAEAGDALGRMGIDPSLMGIVANYRLNNPGEGGGYYDRLNEVVLEPRDYGSNDRNIAIHEMLHGFESFLTPDELAQLQALIDANPFPTTGNYVGDADPGTHHPSGSIAPYFDYATMNNVIGANERYTIPTQVLDFVRSLTPAVMARAEDANNAAGLGRSAPPLPAGNPLLPEQGGTYQSQGTPYGASPDWQTLSEMQQFDAMNPGSESPQLRAALDTVRKLEQSGMLSADQAQEYYAWLAGQGPAPQQQSLGSKAITPLGPLADLTDYVVQSTIQNRNLANAFNPVSTAGGAMGTSEGYYPAQESLVRGAANLVLPQSPLDLALMGIPAAMAFPEKGLYGALAEGLAFGTGPLDALPDTAKLRSVLEVPQYADEASRLAGEAGRTVIPRATSNALAETAPLGVKIAGAGESIADEATKLGDEFAGNIRLSKYPEDIQPEIKAWADANPDAVEAARRGTISNAETLASAKQLVEDTGGNFTSIQKAWRPGDAWNAEEITALRGVLNEKTQTVLDAAKAVQNAGTEENQIALVNALREQARVQEAVHGVTAEAGRALQSLKMDAAYLASNPQSAIARNLVQQAGFDPEKMGAVAEMLTKAADNPAQVNAIVRALKKPDMWDYLTEIWINSLLSGPMTHARNFISNLATTALSPVERAVAAGVEGPLSRLQGRQAERFFGEAGADAWGALGGIHDGVSAALHTITHGGIQPGMASKIEFEHAFKGTAGNIIRAPSTMLEASDALFTTVNNRAALSALALRQARKEGLHGTELAERIAELTTNPPDELVKAAKAAAEYRVFRAPAGEWTRSIMNVREKIKPLRFVIPFLRTPVNLMKFGIERSPLGLLDPKLYKALKAGSPEASDQIARVIVGSGIGASLALGVASGQITGPVPSLSGERDRFYREGKQPFSLKIGDQWVSYQQLEPFNQSISQVYAAVDAMRTGGSADAKVAKALTTIGTNLVSQTYMTGLSDAINAIRDPDRYGEAWLSRMAGGFVPFSSALRTIDRAVDPKLRDAQGIKETIESNIPGLSNNLMTRLDAFGNEVNRATPFYSPIGLSQEHISTIDAELGRLGSDIGFVGDSITVDKAKYALSREEQWAYQRMAGQTTQAYLDLLIADPRYEALDDAKKAEAIDKSVSKARAAIREDLGKVLASPAYQKMSDDEQKDLLDQLIERELSKVGVSP